ncbi:MAG: DUF167 family protein [Simkaniaceae bacterium]|nr:DUF167 family protein [Simkaniaceae bacterium]
MGRVQVKVVLKSSSDQIIGFEGNILKVKLNAIPEKGHANKALIRLLSKALHLPKTSITIVQGETSRQKILQIEGLSDEELREKLTVLIINR